jgi:hypothetical protein
MESIEVHTVVNDNDSIFRDSVGINDFSFHLLGNGKDLFIGIGTKLDRFKAEDTPVVKANAMPKLSQGPLP